MADDDDRPKYPDPPKIRAHITIRPDGEDVVASVSDEEGDIEVIRGKGLIARTPQEREYLLAHLRKVVREIAEDAVAIGGELVRFRVAAALRGVADGIDDGAPDDEGEATVLRLERDDPAEEEDD